MTKDYTQNMSKKIGEADAYVCKTKQCLRTTELREEMEALITIAQDHNLPTKTYYERIMKDDASPPCRIY